MNKRKHVHNKSSKPERSEGIVDGDGTPNETNETLISKTGKDYTAGRVSGEGNKPSTSENITMEVNCEAAVESNVHYFPRKKGVRARRTKTADKSVAFEEFEFSGSTKDMIGSQVSAGVSNKSSNNEDKITHSGESRVAGFIFMCNDKTKQDCYRYRVFGLPDKELGIVKRIKKGTKLYLFNFNQKILYGIYSATSDGDKNLESDAFGGLYQAQVRFRIFRECVPLPEKVFREAMKENYCGRKFDQELNDEQVRKLSTLFQSLPPPIRVPSHELNSGIKDQRNLSSMHGYKRVAAQARRRPYSSRGRPRKAVVQATQPGPTGNQLPQPYTGGAPQRTANLVTEPGQHPYLVAKPFGTQFVEPHQVRYPDTAILQHDPYGFESYETNRGVIVTDWQFHPAAYASGVGTSSTQPQLYVQQQPWVKDAYANDGHTSHSSKQMEGSAPGYQAEFGHTQEFMQTNLPASSYSWAPWYRRIR